MSDSERTSTAGARPRVAVVFGGRSSEHAISCVTAGSVLAALDPATYDVVAVGVTRDGRWVLESADPDRLRISDPSALPAVDGGRTPVTLAPVTDTTGTTGGAGPADPSGRADLVVADPGAPPDSLGSVDVVFPVLHGPWGEDGTIQGMLELAGVRYVGAGVLASAVSMDKHYMKVVLADAGLEVMPSVTVTASAWAADPDDVRRRAEPLGWPLFVKPARGGSSIGISKVAGPGDLAAALEEAFAHDPKVLVEQAADGAREIECGVLQDLDGATRTSLPAEIRITGDHDFYDFEAKYLPEEATELDVPAHLPDDVTARMRDLSARAFEAVGGEGLARVDFFCFPDGRLVVNEINTMPGFTPLSMYPRMWAASGLDYPALVDRLVRLALRRGTGLR